MTWMSNYIPHQAINVIDYCNYKVTRYHTIVNGLLQGRAEFGHWILKINPLYGWPCRTNYILVISDFSGCQPDEPLASGLVTTNRIINVYDFLMCNNVTHVCCPSLFVFCWELNYYHYFSEHILWDVCFYIFRSHPRSSGMLQQSLLERGEVFGTARILQLCMSTWFRRKGLHRS